MCRLVRLCQVLVCTAALCIAHTELTHWCALLQHGYALAKEVIERFGLAK